MTDLSDTFDLIRKAERLKQNIVIHVFMDHIRDLHCDGCIQLMKEFEEGELLVKHLEEKENIGKV